MAAAVKVKLKRQGDAQLFEIELLAQNEASDSEGARSVNLAIDGRKLEASIVPMPDGSAMVELEGRRVRVAAARRRAAILAAAGPFTAEFSIVEERAARRAGGLASHEVDAPMPGKVLKVLVGEGQGVAHGEALIVLEAMKMETTLYAESAAVVSRICVAAGQMVDHGTRLIELSPPRSAATPPESPPQDD
jgi:3-methylcrotonyl-CoA carboxylase alpha subunit